MSVIEDVVSCFVGTATDPSSLGQPQAVRIVCGRCDWAWLPGVAEFRRGYGSPCQSEL